jgi:hypothetical protein
VKRRIPVAVAALGLVLTGLAVPCSAQPSKGFSFAVAADMRKYTGPAYDTPNYFLGALEAIRATGPVAFMIIPGDLAPPSRAIGDIRATLGPDIPVYVAVGNHDLAKRSMDFIRGLNAGRATLPNIVRQGPPGCRETMYAFEWGDTHVAVLNEYFDGTSDTGADGDVTDATFAWLSADLATVTKPFVFVVGHDPAYAFPDMTSGRVRHEGGGLEAHPENRDRFWRLLQERHVTAYICAHTHNASARKVGRVWQLDAGHARGKKDRGAPSTFIRITVGDGDVRYEYHRAAKNGLDYRIAASGSLVND